MSNWPDWVKSLCLTIAFALVALFSAFHHEPWRDEIQAWLIATEATSFIQLFENCRYEGHPMLWHTLLYGISHFTNDIFAMQILSVVLAGTTVFLFCYVSPFAWYQKVLFSFGFYPLFQYGILSRSYGLVMLCVVLFAALVSRNPRRIMTWLVLVFMANTSATGFVLACCFAASIVFRELLEGAGVVGTIKKYATGLSLLALGLILAAWQIYPEPDNNYTASFSFDRLKSVFSQMHDSYLYVAYWNDLFSWNTVYMRNMHALDFILSFIVFLGISVLLKQHKSVLFLYVLSTLSMVFFLTVSNMIAARFIGHFYLILIAAFWLYAEEVKNKVHSAFTAFFTIVLICQVFTAFGLVYSDVKQPFSNAKAAAHFLREKQFDKFPITGGIDYTISPISYWLNKPLYYIESQSLGKYIVWSSKRNQVISPQNLIYQTDSLVTKYDTVIVILSSDLFYTDDVFKDFAALSPKSDGSNWVLLKKIEGALVQDENYYIYLASRKIY